MARNVTDSEWQSLNILSCSHCNLKTSDAAFFQAHPCKPKKQQITAGVSYSLVTAKFTCSLCTIELSETEFCEHLEGHMSLKPYVCKYCKRDFATRTDVCEHLRSSHEQCEQIFVLKLSGRTKEIVQKAKNNGKEFYKPLNVQLLKSSTSVAISKNLTQNLATVPGPSQKITKSPIASHPLLSSQDAASSSLSSTVPIVNQMVALRTHSHIASQPISNTALASPRPQLPGEQRRYFVIIPTQPQPGLVPTLSSSIVQTQAPSCPSQSVSVPVSDVFWRHSLSQRLPGQVRAPLVFSNVTSRLQGMGPHRISMQLPVTTLPNPATQAIQLTVPYVTQSINTRENHMVANELSSSVNQINTSEQFIHTVAPGFCLNQVYLSSPSVQNETGIQITPPILSSLLHNAPASPAVTLHTHKGGNQLAPTFPQTPVKQPFLPAVVASTEGIVRNDSSVSPDVPAVSTDVSVNYHSPAENDAGNIYKVSIQPFAKDIKPNIESESNVESDNVSRDFAQSVNLQTHQMASSSAAEVEHEQSSQAVIKSEDATDDDTDGPMQIRIENIMSLSVFPDVSQPDVHNNATGTESHLTEAVTNGEQQTKTVVSNTCPFLGLCKGYFVCLVCRLKWCSDSDLFFKHVWEKHTHEAGNSCCPTGYSPYCARLKAIVQAVYDRSQETMPDKFKSYFTPKSCTEIEDVQNISLLSENSNLIPSITENSNLIPSITENSNLIPSITENSNLIPSITENSNLIPSLTENSNLIPSITENSNLIPSITENSNLIPSLTENSNLIPSLTENSNLIPSLTENSTSTQVSSRIETVQQINISQAPSSSVSVRPGSAPSEQNLPTESVPCTKESSSSPPVALRPDQLRQVIENSPDFGAPTTDNELNKCTQDIHGSAIQTEDQAADNENTCSTSELREDVDLSHENLQNVMAVDLSSAAATTSDHPKSNSTTRTYEDISDDEFGGGGNDCDRGTGRPNYSLLESLYSEDEMPLDLSKKTTQAEKSHGDATATSLSANETAAMSSVAHTDSLSPGIETIHDSLTVFPSSANEVAATNSVPQIEGLLPESIRNSCDEATFTPLSTTETAVGNSRKRTERLSTESTGMGDDDEFSLRCFYVCGICRLSWPKAVELEAHIKEDHALQQDLPCTYCQFMCSSSKHLIQHMEDHITINNRKTFSCSLLENSDKVAQFENNDMKFIIRMLKTSVAENDVSDVVFHFVCNTCQSEFEDLVRLGAHLQESLLKVIGCKHCESFFLNSFSWQKHMATEHVDLPRMYCLKQKLLCLERKSINNTPPQDILEVSNTERDEESTAQENQCGSTHGYCQTTPETTSNILGKIEIGACTVIEKSKADGVAIESTDTHSSHEERDATAMTDVIQVEAIPDHISTIPKLLDLVKSSRRIKSVLMSAVSLKTAKVSERGSFLDTASTSIDRRGDNIVVEQVVTATCTSTVTKKKGNTEVDVQGLVKPVSAHGSNELAEIVSEVPAVRAAFDSITTAPPVNHCLNENSESNFVEQAGICEISKSGVRNDTCTLSIENSVYGQMVSNADDNLNLDQVTPVESQGCGVVSGLDNRSRVSSDVGNISAAGLELTETGIRLVLSEQNKLKCAENNCLPAGNIGTDTINNGQESGQSISAVLGKSCSSAVQYEIENGVSNVLEESEAQAVCIAVNEKDICQTVVLSSQTSAEGGNKNKEMQTSALLSNNSQHSNEEARNTVSRIAEVNLSSSLENREKSIDHTASQQTLQGAHVVDQACESGHDSEIGMNGLQTEPFISNRSLCTSTASSLLHGSGDVLNTVNNSLDPDHDSCRHDDICSIQDPECELDESASEIIGSDETLGTDTHSIGKTSSNQKEDNQAVERSAREGEACGILYNKNSLINIKDRLSVRNETSTSEEILEENVLNLPSDIGNFVEEKNSPFSKGQFSTTAEVSERKGSSHTELLPDKVSVEEDFNNSVTRCKCGALISSLTDVNVADTVQPQDKSWWMPISGMCDKCRLVAEESSQPENTTKHVKSEVANLITSKGNKMLSEKAIENCVRALKRKAPLLISENTGKISRLENVSSDDEMRSKVDPSEISPIKQIVELDHCKLLSLYNKPYVSSEQAKVSPMLGCGLKTAALKCDMFLSERGLVAHEFVTSDKEMLDLPCKRKSEAEQGETKTLKQMGIHSEKHRKTEDSDHEIQSLDVTVPNSANFNCSVCTFFTSPSYTTLKQHIKTQHPHDTRAKVCRIRSRSLQNATGNEFQSANLTEPDTANFRCSACTLFTSPSYSTLKQHIKSQHSHDTRAKVCRIRSRSLQNAADQIEKLENPTLLSMEVPTLLSMEVGKGGLTMSHVNFTAHQQPGMNSKTNIACCETVVKNKSSLHAEAKHKSVEVDSKSPYIVVTKLKTGIYVCLRKKCDFTCEWDLEKMKEHINSKHPYYSCGHCKAPYTKLEILQRHLKFVHRGLQPSIVGGTIEVDRLFKCVGSSHNGQRACLKDVTSQTPAKRKKHRSSCSSKKCKAEARRELNSLETKRHTSSPIHDVSKTGDQKNQPPEASTSKTKKTAKENVESRATTAQALQILQSKLAHSDSKSILEPLSREVSPVTEYEASTLEKTAAVSSNGRPLSAKTDGNMFEKTLGVKLPQIDLASGIQPSSSRVVSIVAEESQGEAEKSTAENNMSTFSKTFADIHRQPTTDPTDSLPTKKTVTQNAASSFSPLPAKNGTSRPEYQKSNLQSSSLEASKYSKIIKRLGPSLPSKHTDRREGSATTSKHISKNVSLKPGTGVKSSVTIKKQELISNNISNVPETDNTHENVQVLEICSEAASTYMSDAMRHHINAATPAVVTPVSFSKTQDKKPCGMPDQLETKTAAEGDHYKAFEAEGLSPLHSEANPSVQSGSKTESMCENTATTSKMKSLNKNDYPLRCTVCSIILKCLRDTERHYIRKHPKKDIKLAERNSGFLYSSSGRCLQWDDVNNAPADSYLCHYCAFRSSKRSGVEAHINSIHPEREVKVFSLRKPKSHKHCTDSKVADSPHRPSRSNSPTPSQYFCLICKEIKYSEFQFRLHLASHSNFTYTTQLTTGTSFLCHTCGYVAKSNSDLAQHTGEHMSERRFKCFLCDHDSHNKQTLRNHIRLVHNKTVDGDMGIIDRCKQRSANLRPRLVNIDPRVHLIDPFRQHPNYLQKLVLKYDIKVLDLPGNIYTDILHHEHKEYDEYFDINKLM